jgi:hypothetical protein
LDVAKRIGDLVEPFARDGAAFLDRHQGYLGFLHCLQSHPEPMIRKYAHQQGHARQRQERNSQIRG